MHLTVVDAFTDKPFSGNPAAVAILDAFEADDRMQAIAAEMNLSETAFVVPRHDGEYDLRWFTPTSEVKFCGHATLASAHALGGTGAFHTHSGRLACTPGTDGWIEMDFPALPASEAPLPSAPAGLAWPRWTGVAGEDWLVEVGSAQQVIDLSVDVAGIAALGRRGMIVTAAAEPGDPYDFVSRFFAPNIGIDEDPATGSAHCALAAYWAPRLGRDEMTGYQASPRGGTVKVRVQGDRVVVAGKAVTVSEVELVV